MAIDATDAADIQTTLQLDASHEEAAAASVRAAILELHTCQPGIIVSFDPDTQTAVVQPAIQRIIAGVGPLPLPACMDVPVSFPRGGGLVHTFPVARGDECILHFSERAIDFWLKNGGINLPSEWRTHDLSDAFASVGVSSKPNFIKNFLMTGSEIRTLDGQTVVRVEAGMVTAGNPANAAAAVRADVMGKILAALTSHVHSGVTTGAGVSGPSPQLTSLPDPSAKNVKVS